MKANLSSERSLDPISHDGIHDALTFLPAPSYFYQYLYREIVINEESNDLLTPITLVITPKKSAQSINEYEISIINFAKALNRSIRQSDLAARIGGFEFLIAINTCEGVPIEIKGYIFSLWQDEKFTFSYFSSSSHSSKGVHVRTACS
jgi:GGDEF domain-containing protein